MEDYLVYLYVLERLCSQWAGAMCLLGGALLTLCVIRL